MPRLRLLILLALALRPSCAAAQSVIEPLPAPPTYADLVPPEPAPPPEEEVVPEPTESGDVAPLTDENFGAMLPGSEPVARWYQPVYWFGPAPWDSGIEFGLNGTSGTSESVSFRVGGFVKRSAKDYKLAASIYQNRTQSNGLEVQNNALLDARYDWLFDDSPWTVYVMNQTFFDEFQAFDVNVNANAGFGYQWLKEDWTKLTTSIGTGVSREFGGPDSEWVPEAQFGFNYELQIDSDKKLYAKADWFPEWENFNDFRVLADVGLQIQLHEPSNMSLKLSATDRYDADPQGVAPHNLNYSAMLIWKL
jgi:putative salt-induced outer membrane protein YdiY